MARPKSQITPVKSKPRIIRPKEETMSSLPLNQLVLLLPPNTNGSSNLLFLPQAKAVAPFQKPHFKSVKGYVPDRKEIGNVCRTCYRVIFNHHFIKLYDEDNKDSTEKLRQMLKEVSPCVNLEIYPDPIMCTKCVKMLFDSYEFKNKCADTEEKFNTWILQRKGVQNNEVNLLILVNSSTDNDEPEVPKEQPEPGVPTLTKEKQDEKLVIKEKQDEKLIENVKLDHSYVAKKQKAAKVKKKFSYKMKLNSKEIATQVKTKKDRLKGPFLCEKCGQSIKKYQVFKTHVALHDKSNESEIAHKCPHCDYSNSNFLSVKKHIRTHSVSHQCKECSKTYSSLKQLNFHHRTVHLGLTNFQCHICGKSFKYYNSLYIHLIAHEPEKYHKHTCNVCDKKFALKKQYTNHVLSHGPPTFECELCGKKLKRREYLLKHMHSAHNNNSRFQCEICHRCYWREQDLKKHKIRIHESRTVYKCAVCGHCFFSQMRYNRHLSSHLEKTYICDICGKKLKYERSFKMHLETFHGNGGKYKCEFCDKTYWKREDLWMHQFKVHRIGDMNDEIQLFEIQNETVIDNGGNVVEFDKELEMALVEFDMNKENVLVEQLEDLF